MIGRLVGRVTEEEDGTLLVEVGGVGYEVTAPLGTRGRAREDAEGRRTLYVHTHVREDALALFGFATEVDRVAFRTLISVSNVGPKTAVAVLGALPGPELARVIAQRDLTLLTSISGIGKKTAERLLLELKGKLQVVPGSLAGAAAVSSPATSHGNKGEILVNALTRMGYKPQEAERAVAGLGPRVDELDLAALVREALVVLAK